MLSVKLFVIFGTFPGIRVSISFKYPVEYHSEKRSSIDIQIDLHDPLKSRVSAKITLCLKVAATVTFSAGPPALDLQSLYSLNQMTKIVESLSSENCNKLSPAWVRFIHSFDIVVSNARKISEVRKLLSHIWGPRINLNDYSFIHLSRSPWER